MKSVTVLIPTANRPLLLETALRSVAGQTGQEFIHSVIVSENGKNRESEAVCRRFANDLPVRYLFHDPSFEPTPHLPWLFTQVESEYAAFLCDDDWWISGHLQNSLSALQAHPASPAAFSAALFIESESAWAGEIYRPAPLAAAAGPSDPLSWWVLSTAQVLAAAWLCTPFHFSSLVARAGPLRAAREPLLGVHSNYFDRLLEAVLAPAGPLLFYPQPTVGVRLHSGNYRSDKTARHLREADLEGMEKIGQLAKAQGIDLAGLWRSLLPSLPPDYRNEVANRFYLLLGGAGIRRLGLHSALFPSPAFAWMKFLSRHFANPLKPWLPPVLLAAYRRARRRAAGPEGPGLKNVAKSRC